MSTGGALPEIVAQEITTYLAQHPDAADTEEGILRWWLPPDCPASIEVVRAALMKLEQEGLIVTDQVIGGRLIHRRNTLGH
jgi:hypothetical protein